MASRQSKGEKADAWMAQTKAQNLPEEEVLSGSSESDQEDDTAQSSQLESELSTQEESQATALEEQDADDALETIKKWEEEDKKAGKYFN